MPKMANYEGQAVTSRDSEVRSGSMIFEPILEDGVFRFDCSANDRDAAYPSISFVNSKDRDTPITTQKVPLYTPTFECLLEQQIVKLEVSYLLYLLLASDLLVVILKMLIIFKLRSVCLLTLFPGIIHCSCHFPGLQKLIEFVSEPASCRYLPLWNWRS